MRCFIASLLLAVAIGCTSGVQSSSIKIEVLNSHPPAVVDATPNPSSSPASESNTGASPYTNQPPSSKTACEMPSEWTEIRVREVETVYWSTGKLFIQMTPDISTLDKKKSYGIEPCVEVNGSEIVARIFAKELSATGASASYVASVVIDCKLVYRVISSMGVVLRTGVSCESKIGDSEDMGATILGRRGA